MKIGKVAGLVMVPAEALKVDMTSTVNIQHSLFKEIWDKAEVPDEWKEGLLSKLPKSGNLRECDSYRGIVLLSIRRKMFSRILLDRMKTAVDAKLRDQQAGFRNDRSCIDHICTLQIILEQALEWNSSVYVNFIDYEKAFDSVDRETLWQIMSHYVRYS